MAVLRVHVPIATGGSKFVGQSGADLQRVDHRSITTSAQLQLKVGLDDGSAWSIYH